MSDLRVTMPIQAAADLVWAIVADLPRTGDFSPECERVTWRGDAAHAAPGAEFIGWNRRGGLRWTTHGKVISVGEPGNLVYEVRLGPIALSRWEVIVAPEPDGRSCTVAQLWTDLRPAWLRLTLDRVHGDRRKINEGNVRRTLEAIRHEAERLALEHR